MKFLYVIGESSTRIAIQLISAGQVLYGCIVLVNLGVLEKKKKKLKIKSDRTIFNLFMQNLKKLPLVSTGITPWEMKTTFFFVDFVGFNIPVSTVVTACQIKSTCNADFEINLISFLFFT